jgi:hypothetical protein
MNQDERNELRNKHHLIEQDPLSGTCRHCGDDNDQHGIYVNEKNEIESWPCLDKNDARLGTFFQPDTIGYCILCCDIDDTSPYPCDFIRVLDAWEATL